ncbi:MAG TPA: hypothetical protein PK054_03975 [Anaerohalosphaeraceae bacterium]|nr:hypothetical protein [Anaerohalosphaeraceae bacterium]HPP55720.1 hypothetical protein [Anaerohalosphaeraceae bacterium]
MVKESIRTARAALLSAAICVLLGCSDDPDHQAQKKVSEKTEAAAALLTYEGNVEGARAQLDQALLAGGGAAVREPAYLTIGNIELTELRRQAEELETVKQPVLSSLIHLAEQVRRIGKLRNQQQGISQMLESGQKEIAELEQALSGGGPAGEGLVRELAKVREELAALTAQRQDWTAKAAAADEQLSLLQAQADERFQEAKLAGGPRKTDLEKAAYEILLKKKSFYTEKQEALTQAEMVERQIALVEPRVEQLAAAIEDIRGKLEGLRQSEQTAQLRAAQDQLAGQIQQEMEALRQMVAELRENVGAYQRQYEQVNASIEKVLGAYERIQSRSSQPTVLYKKGQIQSLAGQLAGSRLQFELMVSVSVEGLIKAAGGDAAVETLLREGLLTVAEDEWLGKASTAFDEADKTFEQALAEGRSLSGEAVRQYAVNVTASRLLNLHSKMKLADSLDRYELADAVEAVLKEQMQKAAELGPIFTQSETARLLEKGLNYQPQMPYDSELYFESLRPQLTAWKQVQGTPQQREQAAREALALIEQYEAKADEKMLRLLQAEKQTVQAAIERGFEEPAPSTGPSVGEPNQP